MIRHFCRFPVPFDGNGSYEHDQTTVPYLSAWLRDSQDDHVSMSPFRIRTIVVRLMDVRKGRVLE